MEKAFIMEKGWDWIWEKCLVIPHGMNKGKEKVKVGEEKRLQMSTTNLRTHDILEPLSILDVNQMVN